MAAPGLGINVRVVVTHASGRVTGADVASLLLGGVSFALIRGLGVL